MKKAPGSLPGPSFCQSLHRSLFETGYLFLEPKLLLLELPYPKRVRGRVADLLPDRLIQATVTVSQFADTSFDGHGLRLHV